MQRKKILVLTDKYYPRPLANAICIQNVIDYLISEEVDVDVLAYKDSGIEGPSCYHSAKIHYIKPDYRNRLFYYANNFPHSNYAKVARVIATFMNRTKKIIMLPFFPLYSFTFPKRLYKKMEEMEQMNHYDLVISVFAPIDTVMASYWFKKRHENIKWCIYALDTFVDRKYKFLIKRGEKGILLERFLRRADKLLYMKSRKEEYAHFEKEDYKNKFYMVDIPLMERKQSDLSQSKENDIERWVYAGSLSEPHYKAKDLIDLFLLLPANKKRELIFYSNGKQVEEIRNIEAKTQGKIKVHDYVPHDELLEVYKNADVLVSMKYTELISAKIFEYMTFGKKVLHISGCEMDPNAEYINRYDRGCVIEVYKYSQDECLHKMIEKLDNWNQQQTIECAMDLNAFEMNFPEYTGNIIKEMLYETVN